MVPWIVPSSICDLEVWFVGFLVLFFGFVVLFFGFVVCFFVFWGESGARLRWIGMCCLVSQI